MLNWSIFSITVYLFILLFIYHRELEKPKKEGKKERNCAVTVEILFNSCTSSWLLLSTFPSTTSARPQHTQETACF